MSRGHKMSNDVEFSRQMLVQVHKDIKRIPGLKGNIWKLAWVWTEGGRSQSYTFNGPDKYVTHIRATNAFEARATGWGEYIKHKDPALHAQLEKEAEAEFAKVH